MLMVKKLWVVAGLASSALFPVWTTANADDGAGWSYKIVIGAEREPTYVGSDRYQNEAAVDFEASYQTEHGDRYFIGLGEVGAYFSMGNNWWIGTGLEYEEGRDNSDDPILTGFAKVEDTIEGHFAVVKKMGDWSVSGVFQPDLLDRGKGLVYFFALDYEKDVNSRLSFNAGMDVSFADAEHMNTEVGVTNAAAAASGLDVYNADSGYKSTTIGINLSYAISEQWHVVSSVEAEFYGSNITDSPLVRDEGNDVNYEAGLGLLYAF